MDIRKDLSNFLEKYGHYVIYIRRDMRYRCECYSERNGGQAYFDCPKCFGTGYIVTIEKIKTRRNISSVPESLVRSRKSYEPGQVAAKAYVYYMEHHVKPKEGDLILEVEWKNGVPMQILEKNMISVADPKQGIEGRVEFYEVYSRFETERKSDQDALTYD